MSTWNLPPPPGFQGLRDDLPLEVYVRHLPHWRQKGATYFVTFRLGDSLPQSKLHELAELRRDWERRNSRPNRCPDGLGSPSYDALEELARLMTVKVETWLDEGMGSCLLKDQSCAGLVTEAMHHFDGEPYELGAYVVMPNHIHAIVRPIQCAEDELEAILKSWKQFSSTNIHQRIGGKGALWQEESYDRIIRDEEHLDHCLQYLGANLRKAGLPPAACPLWVRPQWRALGWDFRM